MSSEKLISKGAEAYIYLINFFDMPAIKKVRIKKDYREPSLDLYIRRHRTKREAKLLSAVKKLGVPAPVIYDIEISEYTIVMEYIEGKLLKNLLLKGNLGKNEKVALLKSVGKYVAIMHKSNIIHGDLTTSNIIVTKASKPVFIDFGLGEFTSSIEDKGIELRVFYTALNSTHYEEVDFLFDAFLDGYEAEYSDAHQVIKKFTEISQRGRYIAGRRIKRKFMPS